MQLGDGPVCPGQDRIAADDVEILPLGIADPPLARRRLPEAAVQAVALLEEGDRARLDEVALPAAAAEWSVPELIVQAEKLLATISFDQLPARASGVVIDLGDLVGETRHG